jgi:hypothetical protein
MSTLNVGRVNLSSGLTLPEYSTATLPVGEIGLMVYDNTEEKIKVHDGTKWISFDESASIIAAGGVIQDIDGYRYHVYTTDNPFTVTSRGYAEVLVVAGGGGGGGSHQSGGGGGAGGIVHHPAKFFPVGTYPVQVGGGGQGGRYYGASTTGNYGESNNSNGFQGGDSSIYDIVAVGGGGGNESFYTRSIYKDGGSGGGAGDFYQGVRGIAAFQGGNSKQFNSGGGTGYGNPGGSRGFGGPTEAEDSIHATPHEGAGGGGAGGPGGKAMGITVDTAGLASDGGIGLYFPQFAAVGGSPAGWFGGGGGGGFYWYGPYTPTNAPGSNSGYYGGGGRGYAGNTSTGNTAGVQFTGGGGGGGSGNNTPPNALPGGSGIVIIRYAI